MIPTVWEGDAVSISSRIGLLGSRSQSQICSDWSATAAGPRQGRAQLRWAHAQHSAFITSRMPALELCNHGSGGRSAPSRYYIYSGSEPLLLQMRGSEAVRLAADDMILLRSTDPMRMQFDHDYQTRILLVDEELLAVTCPDYPAIVGRKLAFPFDLQQNLRQMMQSAEQAFQQGKFDDSGDLLCASALHMLRFARPANGDGQIRTPRRDLCSRVQRHIEMNFDDPDLSTGTIARYFGVSGRYIQLALTTADTTPSDYILKVRLKAAAGMLRNASHLSITDIAFACGFNASGHFATLFRKAYGMPPRAYRSESPMVSC